MASPLLHAAVPAAFIAFSKPSLPSFTRSQWKKFFLVSALLANAPDIDFIPALLFREHFMQIHRAWGHNIHSALLFSFLGALLFRKWVSNHFTFRTAFLLAFILVLSHLFLDALGHVDFDPSVPLLWPLSNGKFTLSLPVLGTPLAGAHYPYSWSTFTRTPTYLGKALLYETAPFLAALALFPLLRRTVLATLELLNFRR